MIRAIVTDIEGTTSDIAFVKNVLFPYARAAMDSFVLAQRADPSIAAILADVAEIEENPEMAVADIIQTLIRWIDEDKKITPLKTLQGHIWAHGYRTGDFTGHIYDDAAAALRAWHAAGIQLYVYSSGSIFAQKLLFGHSDAGDLTPLFSGYFDTTTGGKRETESYAKIPTVIGLPANEILFLSDIIEELDAARAAGMQTTALNRDGLITNANGHTVVTDFSDIQLNQRAA
ncbi:MAG TPA: acireductone synthase [Alphaproteobacteria bacterium]|nr:acireductone synthase [Alphaproteobacteria bacterium]